MNTNNWRLLVINGLASLSTADSISRTNGKRPLRNVWNLLVAVFVMTASEIAIASDGIHFESNSGRFSVTLPSQPMISKEDLPNSYGKATMHSYFVETYSMVASISVLDTPFTGKPNESEIRNGLAGSRDGMLRKTGSILLKEQNIKVQGYPALDFWAETGDGSFAMRSRVILVNRRQYQLVILHSSSSSLPRAGKVALDTFRIH